MSADHLKPLGPMTALLRNLEEKGGHSRMVSPKMRSYDHPHIQKKL